MRDAAGTEQWRSSESVHHLSIDTYGIRGRGGTRSAPREQGFELGFEPNQANSDRKSVV